MKIESCISILDCYDGEYNLKEFFVNGVFYLTCDSRDDGRRFSLEIPRRNENLISRDGLILLKEAIDLILKEAAE